MTVSEFYAAVGGDYTEVLARLSSDALIVRFLRMLPRDGSMELLCSSMASGNGAEAFRAVHSIKGMALNLGLPRLAEVCSLMTEALRGRSDIPESCGELFRNVQAEYDRVCGAISQLE